LDRDDTLGPHGLLRRSRDLPGDHVVDVGVWPWRTCLWPTLSAALATAAAAFEFPFWPRT
jgi:hypothetical protein